MTTEELLTPRWEVVANFPKSTLNINDILTMSDVVNYVVYFDDFNDMVYCRPDNYPAIFKKLTWWGKRNEEELPEYLKINNNNFEKIVKVDYYMIYKNTIYGLYYYNNGHECCVTIKMCSPSTKEEYDKQTTGTTTN